MFDPAGLPAGCGLSIEVAAEQLRCRWTGLTSMPAVDAIWQGVVVGGDLAGLSGLDAETQRTCLAASEMALAGMLESLDVFTLDPFWSAARASNKPYQLRLAVASGLDAPRTLIGNDPDAVRDFARRCGPLVTKMLVQPAMSGGDPSVVFTSPVSESDLADLDGLRLCPMIFQERIDKAAELRVVIAGKQVFAAAIDAGAEGVDWRREQLERGGRAPWRRRDLPPDVASRLVGMLDHLGLNQGAFDLVVTPEGRHVFLELNPFGSFVFLGEELAAPIAAAIADVLVQPEARRPAARGTR